MAMVRYFRNLIRMGTYSTVRCLMTTLAHHQPSDASALPRRCITANANDIAAIAKVSCPMYCSM